MNSLVDEAPIKSVLINPPVSAPSASCNYSSGDTSFLRVITIVENKIDPDKHKEKQMHKEKQTLTCRWWRAELTLF